MASDPYRFARRPVEPATPAIWLARTRRISRSDYQHRGGLGSAFCERYVPAHLVLAEPHDSIHEAIVREKTLKNWKRVWTDELIESANQAWRDLSGTINR